MNKLLLSKVKKYLDIDHLVLWIALFIAISICFLIFSYTVRNEKVCAQLQFKLLAEEQASSIYNCISRNNNVVKAVASFFNGSSTVNRKEFAIFVQPFIKDENSIQALQWVPHVLNKDRARYEKSARDDGVVGFQFKELLGSGELKPAGVRDDYFVVYYNEPLARNETAMGFDNGSEALRRKVLIDAARKGIMVCSPPIKLLQGSKGQKGYLINIPVYQRGVTPDTPDERLKNLKGFATGVFLADSLISSTLGPHSLMMTSVSIDDITDHGKPQNLCRIGSSKTDDSLNGYDYSKDYNISNRRWRFYFKPSISYPIPSVLPAEIRLSFSLLLVFTAFMLMIYRIRVIRLLHESNVKYRGYIEHSPEGVYLSDSMGRYLEANRAAIEQTGYTYEELLGLSIPELTYPDDLSIAMSAFVELQETGAVSAELRLKKKDGSPIPVILNAVKLQDGNFMAFCTDIAERKKFEIKLEVLATTDSLTQVANRRYFFEIGINEINRSMRYNRPFSILMMDIDHFKDINDKYGHASGDAILVELAATCKMTLRDVDKIGRLGGEEFAFILPETDADGACILGERIRKELAAMSVVNNEGIIRLTVSIGTATYHPGDNADFDSILALADKAMYMAKNQGRNRVVSSNGE